MDTDKMASNSVITLAARFAMFFATFIGLPAAAWYMNRLVAAADAIGAKVDQGAMQMQLLQQDVRYGFEAARSDIGTIRIQMTDHEGRLRGLERDPGRPSRTPN